MASNETSNETSNESRQFWMTIVPTNVSGEGDPKCELYVIEHITVIKEPINAKHANDMDALMQARESVARRLGVSIDNVGY